MYGFLCKTFRFAEFFNTTPKIKHIIINFSFFGQLYVRNLTSQLHIIIIIMDLASILRLLIFLLKIFYVLPDYQPKSFCSDITLVTDLFYLLFTEYESISCFSQVLFRI